MRSRSSGARSAPGTRPTSSPARGFCAARCAASTSTGGTRSPRCCPNSSTASPARTGSRSTSNTAEASPPVVNTEDQVTLIESAVRGELGENAVQLTPQSMGGEDFAWYLTHCPGALIRLGTRTPGGITYDIHQGDLLIDERAVEIAARVFTATAVKV